MLFTNDPRTQKKWADAILNYAENNKFTERLDTTEKTSNRVEFVFDETLFEFGDTKLIRTSNTKTGSITFEIIDGGLDGMTIKREFDGTIKICGPWDGIASPRDMEFFDAQAVAECLKIVADHIGK